MSNLSNFIPNRNIYIIICKIDTQWEFNIWLREFKLVLYENLEGWDAVGSRKEVKEGGYLWLIHADVCQKSTQHCKAIILQLKLNLKKIRESSQTTFSHSALSDSLWPHRLQHTRPPCPSPTTGVYSNSCPLSRWCHPTRECHHPLSPTSPPTLNFSQHQGLFKWVSSSHQVAKVLEF